MLESGQCSTGPALPSSGVISLEGGSFPDMNQGPGGPAAAPSFPLMPAVSHPHQVGSSPSSPGTPALPIVHPFCLPHCKVIFRKRKSKPVYLWAQSPSRPYTAHEGRCRPAFLVRTALPRPPAVPLSAQPSLSPPHSHHLTCMGDFTPSQTI